MLHVDQWGQEFFHDLPDRMAARASTIKQLEASKLEQEAIKNNTEHELQTNERHQQLVKAAITRINLPSDLRMIGERIDRSESQLYDLEAKYAELNGLIRQDSLREKIIKAINDLRIFEQAYQDIIQREAQLNALLQQLTSQRHTMTSQYRKIEAEVQHVKDQIAALQEKPASDARDTQINNLQRYIPVYLQSQSLIQTNLLPVDEKIALIKLDLKNLQDQKNTAFQQKQEADKWVAMANPELLQQPSVNHALIKADIELLRKKIAMERQVHTADKALFVQTKQALAGAQESEIGEYQTYSIDQLQQINMLLPRQYREKQDVMKQCQDEIARLDVQIEALRQAQAADEARINEMQKNEWMLNYHRHTDKLIDQLRALIDASVTDYEFKHPANQHVKTRIVLREWQAIRLMTDMTEVQYFHQLLAWLNHAIQSIEDVNEVLAANLQAILMKQELQVKDVINLHLINQEELHVLELSDYNRAMEQLTQSINDMSQDASKDLKLLYQSARLVTKEVDAHCKRENRGQKNVFDIKYYTNILNSIDAVLHNPVNLKNQNNYSHLIEFNNAGRSSLEYKLNAAFLGCLGAMIIVASIITMALTAFIITPLAITSIAIGVAMISGSASFLVAGRQKGVDRALTHMHNKMRLFKPDKADELQAVPSLLVF